MGGCSCCICDSSLKAGFGLTQRISKVEQVSFQIFLCVQVSWSEALWNGSSGWNLIAPGCVFPSSWNGCLLIPRWICRASVSPRAGEEQIPRCHRTQPCLLLTDLLHWIFFWKTFSSFLHIVKLEKLSGMSYCSLSHLLPSCPQPHNTKHQILATELMSDVIKITPFGDSSFYSVFILSIRINQPANQTPPKLVLQW